MQQSMINFLKGILVGIGGVLPGLSGGALAAIFGIYEPLIKFASNITVDFKKNIRLFTPVLVGGIFGILVLARALSYLLDHHLPQVSLFFVGCMLGVLPSLVKQAGKRGRHGFHVVIAIAAAIASFLFFAYGLQNASTASVRVEDVSFFNWVFAGGLIGLGITFPGLSPSNFLLYLGLYQPMNEAIGHFNFGVMIPLALGVVAAFILTVKLVSYLLQVAYAAVYHIILGLVLTSTVMIWPVGASFTAVSLFSLLGGLLLGIVMSRIEGKVE